MSGLITKGRKEISCRNNIGGVKSVFFAKYEKFTKPSIVLSDQELISIPNFTLYEFFTKTASFSESVQNDQNGIFYDQKLQFTLYSQSKNTSMLLNQMQNLFLRYVIVFNDKSIRIGGLYNGARLSYSNNSGGTKQSGSAYNINIESKEEISAPYVDNTEVITGAKDNYIFMNGNNFVFMDDNNNYIFN